MRYVEEISGGDVTILQSYPYLCSGVEWGGGKSQEWKGVSVWFFSSHRCCSANRRRIERQQRERNKHEEKRQRKENAIKHVSIQRKLSRNKEQL